MNKKPFDIKSAVFLSRRGKGGTEGLHSRSSNGAPGRPCQLAALSGRRAAQDGQGRVLGGPERAEVKGLGEVLSAGRAAAPGQIQVETLGRGRSADRVAHVLAERAKPGGSCGHGEAARASARARPFQAMARAVVVLGLFVGPAAAADIVVGAGATGALTWSVTSDGSSAFTIGGVRVEAEPSPCFTDTNQAQRAALTLAAGQTQTVRVEYKIADDADGTCPVTLHLKTAQPNVAASLRDTSVQFIIINIKPPLVSITAEYDFLFDRLHGTALTIPTTRAPSVTVTIHDDIDVGTVNLPGTPNVIMPAGQTLGSLPVGTRDVVVVISGLVPGAYPFSVTNTGGKVTQGSWRVENLALVVNGAVSSYVQASNSFSGTIKINVNSTAGAEKIVQYEPTALTQIVDHGSAAFDIDEPADRPNGISEYFLSSRDKEGNSAFQRLFINQYNFPVNYGEGSYYGQIEIAGSGSVTAASSFPDNVAPGQRGAFLPGVLRVDANDATNSVNLSPGWREIPGPLTIPANQPDVTYSLSANGQVLAFGSMSPNPGGGGAISYIPTIIPVTSTVNFTLTVVSNGVHICMDPPVGTSCLRPAEPVVTARPTVRALAYFMPLPQLDPHIPIFADSKPQIISLGNGASLSEFIATSAGTIPKALFNSGFVEGGNVNLLGDQIYVIEAGTAVTGPFYTPSFKLSLTFDRTKRTGKPVSLARLDNCKLTLFLANDPKDSNIATAQVDGFGRYAVVESKFADVYPVDEGRCHFVSGVPGVIANPSPSSPQYAQAINVFGALGLKSIGATCKLGPTATPFTPPGELKICYDAADLTQASVTDEALAIYQFNEDGVREKLDGLFLDRTRGFAAGMVSRFSSQFGAFAPAPSVPASDLLPPITALALDGRALPAAPSYVMTTTSTLSLQAADPTFPGAPVSGLAGTFILIDVPFVDVVTTPGVPYTGPFSLSEGGHILAYYSSDVAGNIEATRVVSVLAIPPPARAGTRAISLGAANQFWTVAREGAAAAIARTDDNGVAIASASLPQALPDAQWGVLFDGAGAVYAVGTASGASTAGTDLAVYKASSGGDALVSSQILDGGLGGNDLVYGVAAPGWIAGAVQVSGPSNLEIPGNRVFTAALWRFNPADGTVALSTTFARGAALGVASDADGSAWIAGYIENPGPRSGRVYDLALWHYAADGKTLLAGPFRREAYVADFSATFAAKILITNGAVTVSAPRGRPGGGTDLGSVRFDKATGALLSESAWRAADGSSAYPAAMLSDGSGALVAGGLENAATRAALWRYGADGNFTAASLAGAGGARGAAVRGAELWLAADDESSPHKVTGETVLSGSLSDIQPPRAELIVGTPSFTSAGGDVFVASSSLLAFAATDDRLVVGDGLGAGAPALYYRAGSAGPFTAFSSPFRLATEGAHSVDFYGADAADNPGPILSRALTMDMTPPVTLPAQNGAVITLTASDPNGAGVARIRYLVDYGNPDVCDNVAENMSAAPGTCENPWYAGPFTLTGGPHTLAFQAFDAVGNAEAMQFAYPNVDTFALSFGGMGIGRDPSDALWTVVSENNAIAFAHANSAGALLSSETLQDAVFGFPWSVFFDAVGRAYAIGIADGPATQAGDVAVYKASPAGDAVESRTVFDSGYANNDIVLDAKAPGWVVGAAQTSGPVDFDAAGERSFSMALWKFDPALGSIQLSTTYARASFDIGAGVAVDTDGSLWISGYSLRPDAPAAFGFDLSLWHYAADGRTLLGGPFLWPGYLSDFDGSITARIHVSGGAVYIAAPRVNAAGGTDTAFLRFDKATSRTTAESVWRAGDGSTSYPVAILPEASGLLVAGGLGANATQAALWRFGYDGTFQSVATVDAGGAQGAVFKGSELWLSVDGSTVPYRVLAEAPVAGLLIDISTPAAPTLAAIAVTPATASILAGETAQFMAAATFTDGSTRTLTLAGEVAWSTDLSTVAAVSATGLATGLGDGTAQVIASSGTIRGQSALTVSVPTPTVTGISPALGGNAGQLTVTVNGSGIVAGARLALNRVLGSGSGFTTSGALASRLQATAIRLANGKVLIVGGQDINTNAIFSSANIFDPNSGSWSATGAMAIPRYRHTMTLLPDGKVLVAGGTSCSNCAALNTAELYDPVSGTWSYTGSLATVRISHTATLLASGKVLVAGGGSTNNADLIKSSAELYDPATGAWTSAGVMPSGAHFWHAAAALPDGRVVVAGGRNSSMLLTAAVDIYNPASNTWSPATSMNAARSWYTLDVLPNGNLLAAGGDGGTTLASTEIYDPGTGGWTASSPLSSKRSHHTSAQLADGAILVIGGANATGGFASAAELYDPVASSWSTVGSLSRLEHTETLLSDGSVLVAGGYDSAYLSVTSIYRPSSQSIVASNLTYSGGNTIGGVLNLTGQSLGPWDVVVTNPNLQSARLANAFTIHGATPPSAVTGLALSSIGLSTVTLQWTAPASPSGAVASYEIRYASFPLDSGNFASGTSVSGPAPASSGTVQSASIGDLDGVAAFYVALKSWDIYGNVSLLSNVASLARSTTLINGTPETSIWATQPVSINMSSSGAAAVASAAAAQGLTSVSAIYDPNPKSVAFVGGANAAFVYDSATLAAQYVPAASLRIYQLIGGTLIPFSSQTLSGQTVSASTSSFAGVLGLFGIVPAPTLSAISPTLGGNAGQLTVTVNGSGIVAGAGLALNRVQGSGSGFTTSGALVMRNDATSIRLMNGKVLIAGGRSASNVVFSSAEIFDPSSGSWSVTGAMVSPRYGNTMTLLPSGKVLVTGGMSCDNCSATPLKTSELYDPDSGTWSDTGLLASARATHTATLLVSGKILVAGGNGIDSGPLKSAELYNPESKAWTSAGVMPSGAHSRHSAAALPDGRVLIAGGVNASWVITGAVDIYNPDTNTWSLATPMINRRQSYTLNPLPSGKLLAVGGDGGTTLAATEIYDPGTGIWIAGPSLSSKRTNHASVRLADGTILVIGGYDGSSGGIYPSAAELYDPASNSWSTVGSLQRLGHTATFLANGSVLVAGGFNAQFLSVTSIYSPASLSIIATNLTYSGGNAIGGVLDLTGQSLGLWDVVVTNPNHLSARLFNAFTIHGATPPSAVTDLTLSSIGLSTVTLHWTAPASPSGAVASYEIRYASFPLDSGNFASGTSVSGPAPASAGTVQSASIGGLDGVTAFYVALKSRDIYGNVSLFSNVASWVRSTVTVGDQPEFTFSANVAVTVAPVSTAVAPGTVVLATSTAQGLTLVSSIYDLGPEGAVFNPYAQMTFVYSTATLASLGLLPGDIKIYQYVPGAGMVKVSSQTIDMIANTITGYVSSLSSIFAVFGVIKDRTAPVTALVHGASSTFTDVSGNLYTSPDAGFGFNAYDPIMFGTTTGVARTHYRVDGASTSAFFTYTSTFPLTQEGQRKLWFYSEDRAGNVEVIRSSAVSVDATSSITALQVIGSSAAGVSGGLAVSSTTTIALSASDPFSNGVASGVNGIFYAVDADPMNPYSGPFTLPAGAHSIAYYSKDNVGNVEYRNILSILVDTAAPQSVLLVNGAPVTDLGIVMVSTDSLGLSASDSGAGVAQILYSLDGAAEQVYVSTFSPTVGSHTLAYHGADRLGNVETAHQVSLSILLYDVTPPLASLSLVDQSTITTNVPVIVATYGDGDGDGGRGVDVSSVRLELDGTDVTAQAAVSASSMTFSPALSQGAHYLSITFADFAGNRASAAAGFFVDSMPPATILQVDGVTASTTALVIVSTNSLGFASADAGTGVALTVYSLDGAAPDVYSSTIYLAAGTHSLAYHSIDKAGNVEPTNNIAFTVLLYDVTPPSLVLTPATGSTVTTATPRIMAVYSDAGRGAADSSVRLSLDGVDVTSEAIVSASSAVFIPSAALSQATHTVVVQVSDLAGNQSTVASTFLVDSLPPVTTLFVDGLATSATSLVLISTNSIGFSATDAGAGVLETRYSLDGSIPGTVYVSTFGLTAGEYVLTYRSFDLGGTEETAKMVSVSVFGYDVTPPALALTPSNGSTVTVATPLIAALYGDLGRGIDASSVKVFLDGVNATAQAAVTTSSAVFTPGAALSQGAHTVTAEVADLAGNRSSAAATFVLDSIAPVTTLLVNGLAASATEFVLVSTDSIGFSVLDAGVGTAETRYTLDGSTNNNVYASPFNLAAGIHTLAFRSRDLAGNIEAARSVSITVLAEDAFPPALALAPANGSTITLTTPAIRASYSDLGRGVDLASVHISLDGHEVTASVGASSASFIPASALSQGTHTVTAVVSDLAGNAASALATFRIDSLPPLTILLVNGHPVGGVNLVLASTDAVSFFAADTGVGVLETRYSVDGASEAVFTASFVLSPGSLSLVFHSSDRAGNLETTQAVSVIVTTPSSDTTPPLVRLDVPGPSALGVEQALGGVVDVRGGVSDASALNWTLEAAPGASAAGGFMTIASGAGNLSGLIAAWNTISLSGYQTVRLRATDAFGNSASATATVFVGSPVFTFAIGRKDSNVIVNTIKGPTGIAVRSDGAIWVANAENDKILLLSPAGVLLGEAGHAPGHSGEDKEHGKKGKDDKDHDDEDAGGLSFKTPHGLALDAADNLYVADRDLNRVVKLSSDGRVLLLQLGKADGQGRSKPGSGPGELRHPFDVAVDVNGDIYVADSGNRRIQVFNSSGGYLRQFGTGVLLSTSEVRGIALTTEGLWVSDKEQERVFLFSRAGVLIKSIGSADSAVGEISRMRGLASDRMGSLYVVEPNRDRTQKFDLQGKGLLAFGSKAGLSLADRKAKRYLTQPIDAAVAPDGSLWIADTGGDRIVRYALPVSGGYGVAAYSAGGGAVSSAAAEPAKRVVDHADGAAVSRDDGAGVSVPKGALTADLEITVDKGDENLDKEQKTAKRREMKITAVSEEVQYGPEGTTFNTPVTLILPYDANLLAAQGIREDELKVYYWNPGLKDWQAMPSTVDKQNKTVNAQTTHFSAYQVGGLGGVGVAAIDDFGLRDGYVFPNPSRNGAAVTFRMQPGSVDSIEVRVYDVSGRKIHSSSDFRFLGAFDDGNGKGNQNTYDHVWNVSGIGSGVYTYVMTARKAGQPDIRKTGKVGVIK